ncbi:3-hydroxyacyl-CoA dehydrogenase family protein [Bacillus thermotolerans]|uniref:3-hydroxybutyryl-CoA dehydrogenase n=1 Tax=Bacillus thermotolerans TaxID=1221996 RepID=A0A0F5HJE0_BACTR|nr:3-hydroxyacyl-CoA dehydrogenase family protein [Bacillus thermotolerans]KKB33431.1 3-hydroxybutyryl-CoA dehydrogenase [Bacillus thermotolerans]KKB42862.1 3-hydroxybutyryl-CoA dehydrogenase [Bacillus thermotolerans]
MNGQTIEKAGVIGSGAMGSQIAMVCALAGYPVVLQDIDEGSLQRAKQLLQEQMDKRIKKGRLTAEEAGQAFGRILFTTEPEQLREVTIVIEAIVEKLEVKRELFAELSRIVSPETILGTNSSTIVSSKIADAVSYPERVCNIHFFNPALVMELVEVVKGPHTSLQTAETAVEFVRSIGKTPVLLKKEISGFIANRILGKLTDEALFLLENGYATHEEIDLVCTKALNHPIGPFSLMDLTGLDVNYFVRMQRYQESGNEGDKPSKIVQEKVERGELGRKSGKGFYEYDEQGKKVGARV